MKTDSTEIERLKRYYSAITDNSTRRSFFYNKDTYVFRGRKITEKDFGKDIRSIKISELSYPIPKPNFKFPIGRCNRENESRFYGSLTPKPISFELRAKIDESFFLGAWKITKKITVQHIGFHKSIIKKDYAEILQEV